jgi:hypothetical protein
MSFDLRSASGASFPASWYEWPRLWALVVHACRDVLTPEEIEAGKVNDGYFIAAPKARQVADVLTELLAGDPARRDVLEGATAQSADIAAQQRILEHLQRRGYQSLRPVPVADEADGEDGLRTYELVPEEIAVPEDAGQYPFRWDRVREFAEFCRASDGFRIC